jgi:hypothetical protein
VALDNCTISTGYEWAFSDFGRDAGMDMKFTAPMPPVSRRPARFTQSDLSRAIKAVEAIGVRMVIDIMPDGTIRIMPADAVGTPLDRKVNPTHEIKL